MDVRVKAEIAVNDYDDDKSSLSSVTQGSRSTATSALVSLVKDQVKLVRNLTDANKSASAELQRVQAEKRKVEEEYKHMQEELQKAKREATQQPRSSKEAVPTATALSAIPEEWGGVGHIQTELRADAWVPFQPTGGFVTPPLTPSPRNRSEENMYGQAPDPSRMSSGRDEWSTVVYPSARNVVAEAMPIEDMEAQLQPLHRTVLSSSTKNSNVHSRIRSAPTKTIPMMTTDLAPDIIMREKKATCSSRFWSSFSRTCTFFIPDCLIRREGAAAKQAWREKIAICVVATAVSGLCVGGFGFLPLFLCKEDRLFTWQDIHNQNDGVLTMHREAWTVIHGTIYDVKPYIEKHSGGSQAIVDYLGRDASKLFPRTPGAELPAYCLNPDRPAPTNPTCHGFTDLDELLGVPCHDFATGTENLNRYMGGYYRGVLAHTPTSLKEDRDMKWIIVKNKVRKS